MPPDPSTHEIAESLLRTLRDAVGDPRIAYGEPPVEIEGGFDTRIFAFRLDHASGAYGAPLILRLFAREDDPLRSRWEGAVQNAVAGLGYPAPRVLLEQGEDSPLGAPFVVMERLPGRPMLQVATFKAMLPEAARLIRRYPDVLADCLARLHALDPGPLARALDAEELSGGGPAAGVSQRTTSLDRQLAQLAERIDRLSLGGLRPAYEWLDRHRPSQPPHGVICHGDFHPINVLVDGGAVTGVIDWANATIEDPASDVGNTRLLLAIAPIDQPAAVDLLVGVIRRVVVRRFTRAYQARRSLDMTSVRYFEALRCLIELAWVADRRATGAGMHRNPWGAPRSVRKLTSHFRQVTGIAPALQI